MGPTRYCALARMTRTWRPAGEGQAKFSAPLLQASVMDRDDGLLTVGRTPAFSRFRMSGERRAIATRRTRRRGLWARPLQPPEYARPDASRDEVHANFHTERPAICTRMGNGRGARGHAQLAAACSAFSSP